MIAKVHGAEQLQRIELTLAAIEREISTKHRDGEKERTNPSSDVLTNLVVKASTPVGQRQEMGLEWPKSIYLGLRTSFSSRQMMIWPSTVPVRMVWPSGRQRTLQARWVGARRPHKIVGTTKLPDTSDIAALAQPRRGSALQPKFQASRRRRHNYGAK